MGRNPNGWDSTCGYVSLAFDEWDQAIGDIRSFLIQTDEWMHEGYEARWATAAATAAGAGGDAVEFWERTFPMAPNEFDWMLQSATIKDAVTAFEMYAAKAIDEAEQAERAGRQGTLSFSSLSKTGKWQSIVRGLDGLVERHPDHVARMGSTNPTLVTQRIQRIRALRNLLTHERGQLRTEANRHKFKPPAVLAGYADEVVLGMPVVNDILDDLSSATESIDPLIWSIAHKGRPDVEGLLPRSGRT